MGEIRRFSRLSRDRAIRRVCFLFALFITLALAVVVFLVRAFSSSSSCILSASHALRPDLMFVALVNSTTLHDSVTGLSKFDPLGNTCVFRLYTTTERDFQYAASRFHQHCIGKNTRCAIEIKYLRHARMWGDITLDDVSTSTTVIFLRAGVHFTNRALEWVKLAHKGIDQFYAAGGRRDYVGAAIGCEGEKSLTPWWSHSVGPINLTCAYAPVRTGREDLWAFFVKWYGARRREWVSWPHIWEEDISVPTFWRSNNRNRRDRNLIAFGKRAGRNYEYIGRPYLLWERWYPRWASNYTLRVVSAESNMGVHFVNSWAAEQADESTLPAEGLLATKSGDIVKLGSIWYEPVDAEFGYGYLRALKTIVGDRPEMVSLTIVNSKFLELTKSWLCNIKSNGLAPPNIYWIALDNESKAALQEAGVGQTVDITDALTADNMDAVDIIYGQPAYWKLMLMRTRLIRDLLDRGIDVFLFETDQVWLQSPFEYINKELEGGADMVGTLDTQHNVAGNTILLKSVIPTKRMWGEVYKRFKISYDEKGIDMQPKRSSTFVNHDQYQLSALLLYDTEFTQDFPVALGLLNSQKFVGGSWYSGMYSTEESKRPVIINNNFISGTEKKKTRAIVFGHWFLKEDGHTCDKGTVERALRYEFTKLPGKWWAEEQKRMNGQKKRVI